MGFNMWSDMVLAEGTTTARTAAERAAEIINVKDFGAVGDGATNSTDAFAAAITYLDARGGGILYIPAGVYLVTKNDGNGGIHLEDITNIHIIGAGRGATLIKPIDGSDCQVIMMTGCSACSIQHLSVNGNRSHIVGKRHGIRVDGEHLLLNDVAIDNASSYGIGASQSNFLKRSVFSYIWVNDSGDDGIDIKNKLNQNELNIFDHIFINGYDKSGDGAKTGIDFRGPVQASHIYVTGVNGDNAGIRFRQGEPEETNGEGAHYGSISHFTVIAEGESSKGIDIQARYVKCAYGYITGAQTGVQVGEKNGYVSGVTVSEALGYSFRTIVSTDDVRHGDYATFENIKSNGAGSNAVDIVTNGVSIYSAYIEGSTGYGINIDSDANGTTIDKPVFLNNVAGNIHDAGARTAILPKTCHPGVRNGALYYYPITSNPSANTLAVANNTAYALPFLLPAQKINRIAINITASAGSNARLGIYSNSKGLPYSLIIDGGEVATTGNGTIEAVIAELTLPDDIIWAVVIFDGTPTVSRGTATNSHILGGSSMTGSTQGVFVAQTYGVMPANMPTSGYQTGNIPMICLRHT